MDPSEVILQSVLEPFGIYKPYSIKPVGSGHIHLTYLVNGSSNYILQRVNNKVFIHPEVIETNNHAASSFLNLNHPQYLFPRSLESKQGGTLIYDQEGYPWRIYSYIGNTVTIDTVSSVEEAFEASRGFALLSKNLDGIDASQFTPTIDRFHDLSLRYVQFEDALHHAPDALKQRAANEIMQIYQFRFLVEEYAQRVNRKEWKVRITHNDTKINNILFDRVSGKTVAVIDLDTLMPGYFIYDLGDMVRTFVSPVSEEEHDLERIKWRKEIYDSLLKGYLSEMGDYLAPTETESIPFSGKMMTYMMSLRMLADYLRGNTYYHVTYPEQNLFRARNQLHLLSLMIQSI